MCAPSRYLRCGFDCCKLLCVAVLQWWQGSVSMIVSDIEAAACGRSWLHPAPAPGQEAPGTQPSSAVALVTVLHDCCHALAPTINTTPATKPNPLRAAGPAPEQKVTEPLLGAGWCWREIGGRMGLVCWPGDLELDTRPRPGNTPRCMYPPLPLPPLPPPPPDIPGPALPWPAFTF